MEVQECVRQLVGTGRELRKGGVIHLRLFHSLSRCVRPKHTHNSAEMFNYFNRNLTHFILDNNPHMTPCYKSTSNMYRGYTALMSKENTRCVTQPSYKVWWKWMLSWQLLPNDSFQSCYMLVRLIDTYILVRSLISIKYLDNHMIVLVVFASKKCWTFASSSIEEQQHNFIFYGQFWW